MGRLSETTEMWQGNVGPSSLLLLGCPSFPCVQTTTELTHITLCSLLPRLFAVEGLGVRGIVLLY
jgi:hypothetical protein